MRLTPNFYIFFETLRIYLFRIFLNYSRVFFVCCFAFIYIIRITLFFLFTNYRIFLFEFLIRIFYRFCPGINFLPRYESVYGREYYFLPRNDKKFCRNDSFFFNFKRFRSQALFFNPNLLNNSPPPYNTFFLRRKLNRFPRIY